MEARNALTSVLINLAISRLEFHRDVGTLRVGPDGSMSEAPIQEMNNA